MTLRERVSGPTPVVEAAERAAKLPLHHRAWFQRTLVWGGLLVASQIFAMQVGPYFWPSIPDIMSGAVASFSDGTYLLVLSSFAQMLSGFLLAVVVGVPVGLLMGQFRIVDFVVGPFINALFVTSLVALLPFIILIFGTDFTFRVAVVFLFAVFYLIITPAAGVRAIDRELNEMATSFGISSSRRLLSITLPGTLPYIITGLRLGIGQAVQGMIVAELWVTLGTGRRLMNLGYSRELGQFFATAAAVVLIGATLTGLLLLAQKRLTPWADDVESAVSGAR
ncbi:ABC transporter permease [Mycolicibacterium tokaiense]|uniref:Binding-protein-dependent transport system inner membrane protein n=1 Tax=Mycolicibacterium tokaiense TaxID=39695 RepID=A0A378TMG7_9MYCO|nr:ABC transporter permease subunit [Mycolicibacterium tokaiense]BBY89785.1 ABC transporter permease [Mycolicibacterium tokaiense]STZ61830.1 binding-protein-dependent transport system inner membrane protein [Mycolicibacterium tokaiense]